MGNEAFECKAQDFNTNAVNETQVPSYHTEESNLYSLCQENIAADLHILGKVNEYTIQSNVDRLESDRQLKK